MSLAMGTEAQAEIDSLRERLAAAEAVAAEVARIKAINADLEARNALLELQNEKMRRTLFGSAPSRSEEHTSELQSLMRISYAVFCLKKKISTETIQIT